MWSKNLSFHFGIGTQTTKVRQTSNAAANYTWCALGQLRLIRFRHLVRYTIHCQGTSPGPLLIRRTQGLKTDALHRNSRARQTPREARVEGRGGTKLGRGVNQVERGGRAEAEGGQSA